MLIVKLLISIAFLGYVYPKLIPAREQSLALINLDSVRPVLSELPGKYLSPNGQDTLLLTIDAFGNQVYYLTEHKSNKLVRRASEWWYITEYDYDVDMPENCGVVYLKELYPTGLVTGHYRQRGFDAAHDSLGRIFLCYDITNIKVEFVKVK